ncbi:MAG: antirestriction protein [Betaproteobacteria bacterium]|nr:MAG: antirestriction protein [Betaproteobacteria bacterium]
MSPLLFSLLDFSDVYADACVCNHSGEIIFLSIYGREAGLHQLTAAFHLPASAGGVTQLRIAEPQSDAKSSQRIHAVAVGDARRLEKTTSKFPKGNLFGSLTHMWIYDPAVRSLDRASQTAWLLFERSQTVDEIADRTWETVCDLAGVPLMAHWRSEVLRELEQAECITTMVTPPPLGEVVARYVTLPKDIESRITAMIKSGRIGRESVVKAVPGFVTANSIASRLTARRVAEKDRLRFLPQYFGSLMMKVEGTVYDWMTELSQGYEGGVWDFVELSNGGCYMKPSKPTYTMESPNGTTATLSSDAAGITVMLFALSHLSMSYPDNEQLADRYHELREFALEHVDQREILALID